MEAQEEGQGLIGLKGPGDRVTPILPAFDGAGSRRNREWVLFSPSRNARLPSVTYLKGKKEAGFPLPLS